MATDASAEEHSQGGYWIELVRHARPLAAATLGVGTSLPLFAYTNSVFAPHLLEEFGWTRSEFALLSLIMLTVLPALAVVGRLTDRLGVRRVAMIGTALLPLVFAALSMQNGSIFFYAAAFAAMLIIGTMTGVLVYSRLIAQSFKRAQGLALTVMNCAPAVLAIPAIPLLNWCIEEYGWRAAYAGLGTFVLVVSLLALWLASPSLTDKPDTAAHPLANESPQSARDDYRLILRSSVFWVIAVAMFLCLLQTQLHSSQMNLMIIEQGMTKQSAATIVSIYAAGTILGRVLCGLALDRYSTRAVTVISMSIPAIGFLMLAAGPDTMLVVTAAMFLVGVSIGAESDLICFLVARYFKLSIYSTTLGLVQCAAFLASAVGGTAASFSLAQYDSFTPLLYAISIAIVIGSALFMLLPNERRFEKIG